MSCFFFCAESAIGKLYRLPAFKLEIVYHQQARSLSCIASPKTAIMLTSNLSS